MRDVARAPSHVEQKDIALRIFAHVAYNSAAQPAGEGRQRPMPPKLWSMHANRNGGGGLPVVGKHAAEMRRQFLAVLVVKRRMQQGKHEHFLPRQCGFPAKPIEGNNKQT
jgi:hypothetical protein